MSNLLAQKDIFNFAELTRRERRVEFTTNLSAPKISCIQNNKPGNGLLKWELVSSTNFRVAYLRYAEIMHKVALA